MMSIYNEVYYLTCLKLTYKISTQLTWNTQVNKLKEKRFPNTKYPAANLKNCDNHVDISSVFKQSYKFNDKS